MERTLINNLHDRIGQEITIKGWVDVRRDHDKLIFIDVRDRTGTVQTVALPNHTEAQRAAGELRAEWVIAVTGIVNKRPEKMVNPDISTGDIEVEITGIEVLGTAKELPFELTAKLNIDTELDHRPLTLRTERNRAIFAVQSEVLRAFREFLTNEDFTEFQAPRLVGDDAEGGGNVFAVDYFYGRKAYLATSPQLYKQIMVGVFERVFTTGNVFRAEKHSTTRHLNEYTSIDIEFGFIKDHTDIMKLETRLLRHIFTHLKAECEQEFTALGATLPELPEEIPHLKLREAQELITKETGEDCTNEPDLDPTHERWLCEYARATYNSDFIFVTHYPVSKRPFYTHEDPNDPGFTKSFDLLFRGVEITTGGQRIHEYDALIAALGRKNLNPENFSFYLEAFKSGMPPHGGFGMGLERLTAKFLGLENVKEATTFPRDINRIDTLLSDHEDNVQQ